MQGRSLWRLLRGETDVGNHREDVYCEYYNAKPSSQDKTSQTTMLRTAEHKLTVDHVHSTGELYNLATDPNETHNLWQDPAHTALKADMLLRMSNRMAWTVDPLPERRAPW